MTVPTPNRVLSQAVTTTLLHDHDLPVMVLHDSALKANVELMARYCARRGVLLAPHAKTSMSPYITHLQSAAGSWAVTVATIRQVHALADLYVERVLLANVLVDLRGIQFVARTFLGAEPRGEFMCYVDSTEGVRILADGLADAGASQDLDVLVELGFEGGRTGARGVERASEVADLVARTAGLRLRGIAGFEGLMPRHGRVVPPGVEGYLEELAALARVLQERGQLPPRPVVTAGGSSYFDLVIDHLSSEAIGFPVDTVLRSGCYVTHDHGSYVATSALDGRRRDGQPLRPALELVASVWSRPEPELAIVGFGRRDAPTDDGYPVLLARLDVRNGRRSEIDGVVVGVNDHHAFLKVPPSSTIQPGDVLQFGIGHPCGAFDRWRSLPIVDESYRQIAETDVRL